MKNTLANRRTFLIVAAGASTASLLGNAALAQPAMVAETDAQAQGVGYKADATKVDKAKFPKYAAGQTCANCILYTGKAADAAGPCGLFAGKAVSSKGWCSAWNKKA
ncbi:MAG TPA: high-potential iron-sulfur protein [Burkholderiaceae bacterium]|nr:high-potential iron-sulfur protein [Burkholderiaceae bacterium]